ncbi:hemin ABC transporter substrate-binding protein [uncultured Microscilla sp.]|uniref:heme/hemin ABC transporter substrate-binding protein n=1 Tax=uncultured Microscilla sp. TaxID=432653 RepID=UPI00261F23EA|nr:ABC transporter substrate-binding protein [uncultured Microscilla sp.]
MLSRKLILIPLLMVAFACTKDQSKQAGDSTKVINKKDTAKKVKLPPQKNYKRIVTIGKSITQIVFELGVGNKVVAVDRRTSHDSLPQVGYGRVLRSKLVMKHEPDLVLSDIKGSPEEKMNNILAEGVDYVRYNNPPNIDSTKALVKKIALRLNKKTAGEKIIQRLDSTLRLIPTMKKNRKDTVKVMYVLARGTNILVAGHKTAGEAIIQLAIAKNAADVLAIEGMRRLTPVMMQQANPDYILMSNKSWDSIGDKMFEMPVLFDSRARRMGRIIHLDEEALLGFGLDAPQTAIELCKKLYQ